MRSAFVPTAIALSVLASGAHAQQARTGAKTPEQASSVTLTAKGPEARMFLGVTATATDIRQLLRDMAGKTGATIYFSSSVTGSFTGTFEAMEPDAAISTVAATAGCKVMRINLPKDSPVLSEAAAGKVYEGLLALPTTAVVSDGKTKRSVTAMDAVGGALPNGPVVYYVQGKLTPDQEQAGAEKRAADKAVAAKAPGTAIQNAVQAFQAMTPQDRMQALRDVQRQIFQNMSPQDRQQMFDAMRNQRGRGGRGN